MAEIWKDVVGYEGLYQVSDRGRIKSICSYVRLQNGELMKSRISLNYKIDVDINV